MRAPGTKRKKLESDDASPGPSFEHSLLDKIEHINETQEETSKQVSDVHKAVYDPDDGLFARIRTSGDEATAKAVKIEKDVIEIQTWRENFDENDEKQTKVIEEILEEFREQLDKQETELTKLNGWKERTSVLVKWVVGAVTTIVLGVLTKLIYDLIHDHVKFM